MNVRQARQLADSLQTYIEEHERDQVCTAKAERRLLVFELFNCAAEALRIYADEENRYDISKMGDPWED